MKYKVEVFGEHYGTRYFRSLEAAEGWAEKRSSHMESETNYYIYEKNNYGKWIIIKAE